jgi:hypothetical protein
VLNVEPEFRVAVTIVRAAAPHAGHDPGAECRPVEGTDLCQVIERTEGIGRRAG